MKRLAIAIFIMIMAFPVAGFAANDWYVRPAGGEYGQENGTSYENAWDGLPNVVWGAGGVQPGDNLYVCGLHINDSKDKYKLYSQGHIPLISGTGENARITIRGDYPGDPGIVWGAYRLNQAAWTNVGNGVWSTTLPYNQYSEWFFQDIGKPNNDSYTLLNRVKTKEEVNSTPGTYYAPDGFSGGSIFYVHLTDNGDPNERVYANRYGYQFELKDNKYITFYKLALHNFQRISGTRPKEVPSHITWQGCKMTYGEHSILWFWDDFNYMKVIDCELAWAGNGIYNISASLNNGPSYYLYKGNYIHHMGVNEENQNTDAHCIGVQGGHDGVIEDNICEQCGTGPLLYAGLVQELKNTIVRRNFVKDLHTLGSATGFGISTMCNRDNASDKSGNQFIQNIVVNSPVGYRFQFDDRQVFANNIAYNCDVGLESTRTRSTDGIGASVYARNNIFINTKTDGSFKSHVSFATSARVIVADFDNNLYWPTDGEYFTLRGFKMTYSAWKELDPASWRYTGDCFLRLDPSSQVLKTAPNFFENASKTFSKPSDFEVKQEGAPTVNTGEKLAGMATDFAQRPIYEGQDIGPFEYIPASASTTPPAEGDKVASTEETPPAGETPSTTEETPPADTSSTSEERTTTDTASTTPEETTTPEAPATTADVEGTPLSRPEIYQLRDAMYNYLGITQKDYNTANRRVKINYLIQWSTLQRSEAVKLSGLSITEFNQLSFTEREVYMNMARRQLISAYSE